MTSRFTLKPAHKMGYFVATDHEIGIEVTFKQYDFERTQEIVLLDGEQYNSTEQTMVVPMALREMEVWLHKKHFDEVVAPINKMRVEMGRTIKSLRLQHGMTEKDLSEASGLTLANVFSIESGRYAYRLDVINRIAFVLGAKLEMKLL